MSDLNVDDLPKDWLELSRYLHNNAHDFSAWEQLVSVALKLKQDAVSSRLVAISYENLLVNFPFCEQYWCNYADYLFRAGRTDEAREIYERGVEVVPMSIVIWTKYLDFVVETVHQYDPVIALFERARTQVGTHFYAHLLYDRYLQFLKAHRRTKEYHYLLRRVIEVPLYHYSKYIRQFFKLIENADLDTIKYLITKEDLKTVYKLSWPDLIGRKDDKVFTDLKKDMRKRYMDLYITTQYNVFQLWPFEEAIPRVLRDAVAQVVSQRFELGDHEEHAQAHRHGLRPMPDSHCVLPVFLDQIQQLLPQSQPAGQSEKNTGDWDIPLCDRKRQAAAEAGGSGGADQKLECCESRGGRSLADVSELGAGLAETAPAGAAGEK
ncbi:hypothetical protein KL923_005057 [Ogataea haglerorum]|nr:hypothetical protein KL923_005057 [Ogataea haglerorum]